MPKTVNIIGKKFYRLTVISKVSNSKTGIPRHFCICDCGNKTVVNTGHLKNGHTKSCGCFRKEIAKERMTIHGLKYTKEHKIWLEMKGRCRNRNYKDFYYYGGRGIKVCNRWKESFENFIKDMGFRPSSKYTLDRINNDGDYEPSNCRWATRAQQSKNTRQVKYITFNKKTLCLSDWARLLNLSQSCLTYRLKNKWPLHRALSPINYNKFISL